MRFTIQIKKQQIFPIMLSLPKRKLNQLFIGIIISFTIASCNKTFDVNNVVNTNEPYLIEEYWINEDNTLTHSVLDTIPLNSSLHKQLTHFLKNNSNGWEPIPGSFNCEFSIQQNDFRLLAWENGELVVISYKDKEGRRQQRSRRINPKELDFLFH